MFQACLGLRIDASESKIAFVRPSMPPFLGRAKITSLQVGDASADILLVRHEHDVTVNILRRSGEIDVVVVM
jgi:hypothetical protein